MSPEQLELLLKGKNSSSLADDLKSEYQKDNPNQVKLHNNIPVEIFWPPDTNRGQRNVANTTKK